VEKRYEVFISSTFLDLKEERDKVMRALLKLDFFPVGMELFPANDASQWAVIQRVIDRCDYYVVLVAGRYGSMTESDLSYTEREFDYALAKGIPVFAFVHGKPDEIPAGKIDKSEAAQAKLEAFRAKVSTGRLREEWSNPDDLATKVTIALAKAMNDSPRRGWIRAPEQRSETMTAGNSSASPARPEPGVRQHLQDGDYRAEEVIGEALKSALKIPDIDARNQVPEEDYRRLVRECEAAARPLFELAPEVVWFGKETHHDLLVGALGQLCELNEPRGGFVYLNQLRAYPALLLFYAAGVAATAKLNFKLVKRFHSVQVEDSRTGKPMDALNILSPSYALEGPVLPPAAPRTQTPLSERILDLVKPSLVKLPMMTEKRLDQLFAKFEYFNAIAAAVSHSADPYLGRFRWFEVSRRDGSPCAMEASREIEQRKGSWSPFLSGLFGEDFEAMKRAKTLVDSQSAMMHWHRG
jgi:hypothetical protein